MAALVCAVGASCIVHNWCGQGSVVDGGSHSWQVHPSIKTSWAIGVGWDRQWAWTHLRHRSHCNRLRALESPSPWWHWKHGGSNSDGVSGLSLANWGEMVIFSIKDPLVICACAV